MNDDGAGVAAPEDQPRRIPVMPGFREMALRRMSQDRGRLMQELAQRRAGTVRITKLDLSDVHIRIYGDTAVVTSVADLVGTNGASDISGEYRYTRVYTRRLGHWKIVSFEASRMHDVDARAKK